MGAPSSAGIVGPGRRTGVAPAHGRGGEGHLAHDRLIVNAERGRCGEQAPGGAGVDDRDAGGEVATLQLAAAGEADRGERSRIQPDFAHFPRYEEEYFRQLTAESLVKGAWVKDPNRRNEALDCRVYARAAAAIYGIDRFRERHRRNWRRHWRQL
ncbi:MAG: phage terminase large subunit family protein [Solibacteraceae bacterium]|nr:phage terminase large subunit family protein [Solibacteraceae bacterium]